MSVLFRGNYIGGRFVRPRRGTELISEDPGDLMEPVGQVIADPGATDAAVESACRAFPAWSRTPLAKRIARMRLFQKVLKRRLGPFAQLVAREAGKPLGEATREVERLVSKVDEMVERGLKLVRSFSVEVERGVRGECRWRPLGALAVIGPFNFPVHTPGSHIIPALLLGDTVVFKPSEHTPFVGQALAECLDAAGFPAGTFNLVQGGPEAGARLVRDPRIAGVLFTGSTAAGQAIKKATVDEPQKCLALEMGGKNAALVFRDAPLDLAAREAALSCFSMAGQRCNATSRIIVERPAAKEFLARFLEVADRIKVGYPLEPGVVMGPLISHDAVAKFQRYVEWAQEEGFETLRAGKAPGRWGGRRGYYVTPGIYLCRNPRRNRSIRFRREEVFGPAVGIYLVEDEREAVALNNEVPYGLITALFTASRGRFERLLPQIDTGMVNLNRGTIHSTGKLPFGGTKASGSFRPAGLFSPYYCTVPVAVLSDSRPLKKRSYPF